MRPIRVSKMVVFSQSSLKRRSSLNQSLLMPVTCLLTDLACASEPPELRLRVRCRSGRNYFRSVLLNRSLSPSPSPLLAAQLHNHGEHLHLIFFLNSPNLLANSFLFSHHAMRLRIGTFEVYQVRSSGACPHKSGADLGIDIVISAATWSVLSCEPSGENGGRQQTQPR